MKREIISEALNGINTLYIEEAADFEVSKKGFVWAKWVAVAACITVVAVSLPFLINLQLAETRPSDTTTSATTPSDTTVPTDSVTSDSSETDDTDKPEEMTLENYDYSAVSTVVSYNRLPDVTSKDYFRDYENWHYPRTAEDLVRISHNSTTAYAVVVVRALSTEETDDFYESQLSECEILHVVAGDMEAGQTITFSSGREPFNIRLEEGRGYLIVLDDEYNGKYKSFCQRDTFFEINDDFTVTSLSSLYVSARYDGVPLADVANDLRKAYKNAIYGFTVDTHDYKPSHRVFNEELISEIGMTYDELVEKYGETPEKTMKGYYETYVFNNGYGKYCWNSFYQEIEDVTVAGGFNMMFTTAEELLVNVSFPIKVGDMLYEYGFIEDRIDYAASNETGNYYLQLTHPFYEEVAFTFETNEYGIIEKDTPCIVMEGCSCEDSHPINTVVDSSTYLTITDTSMPVQPFNVIGVVNEEFYRTYIPRFESVGDSFGVEQGLLNEWSEMMSERFKANETPYDLSDSTNLYSFIEYFDVPIETVCRELEENNEFYLSFYDGTDSTAGNLTSVYTDRDLEVLKSGDKELISKHFAVDSAICIGDKAYNAAWVYYHTVEDYIACGISKEMIYERIDFYSSFGFTVEARNAFEAKLEEFLEYDISFNAPSKS